VYSCVSCQGNASDSTARYHWIREYDNDARAEKRSNKYFLRCESGEAGPRLVYDSFDQRLNMKKRIGVHRNLCHCVCV
jgi:hypothetical protein